MKSVVFPKYKDYPNILIVGTDENNVKDLSDKKLLFILDNTGSMGEYINYNSKYSKTVVAKKIINNVLSKFKSINYDILYFNKESYPVCKVDEVPPPNECTYFSPLVSPVRELLNMSSTYSSVIFMSDGLPSEPQQNAHKAISEIGNITREFNCNPVSVAIGQDADGNACNLFAGNRGYNCYIQSENQVEEIANDIKNGIICNYHCLSTGEYIPIEDGKYYYIEDNELGTNTEINEKYIEKYLNLVIHKNMMNKEKYSELNELVKIIAKLLKDDEKEKLIIAKYSEIINVVKETAKISLQTPSAMSAIKTAYRTVSKQV